MGTAARPGRHAGRHAAPASGLLAAVPLPAVGLPVARGRHGRPSHGPAGAALVVVTAGSALTFGLPALGGPGEASAAPRSAALASAPTPLPAQTVSAAAVEARQALADRASRARRAPVAVVTTPMTPPAVSTPVPARPLLPECTRQVAAGTDGLRNGRVPDRLLCDVGAGERLRADAARAYAALAVAYESRFGTAPCLIDGYRTLGEQQVLRRTKRAFAAAPGTSEHGWGLAIDLGCEVKKRRTVQHAWMQENAPRFGWVNPAWAQPGGAKPEPWHWEFTPTS